MDEKKLNIRNVTALVLIIVTIILCGVVVTVIINKPESLISKYTKTYQNVTVSQAKELINITNNLTIIDCRGLEGCSECQFRQGHLPNATLNMSPSSLYNLTNDVLVYSQDGTQGAWFCNQLMEHVYGKVYNLIGGYNEWTREL